MRALLSGLAPCTGTCTGNVPNPGNALGANVTDPLDEVGLVTYPALKNPANRPDEINCTADLGRDARNPDVEYPTPYPPPTQPQPGYDIIGLSSDYRTSDDPTAPLNPSSNLVQSVYWTQCPGGNYPRGDYYGLEDTGQQTTYLAGAIAEAQYQLAQTARPNAVNAIIVLSDGQLNHVTFANGGNDNNPCASADAAATAAKATGTLIYSIAYDSTLNCTDNTGALPQRTRQDAHAEHRDSGHPDPAVLLRPAHLRRPHGHLHPDLAGARADQHATHPEPVTRFLRPTLACAGLVGVLLLTWSSRLAGEDTRRVDDAAGDGEEDPRPRPADPDHQHERPLDHLRHDLSRRRQGAQGGGAARSTRRSAARRLWERGKARVSARALPGGKFCASSTGLAACPAGSPVAGDPRICSTSGAPPTADPNHCALTATEAALTRAMVVAFNLPNWQPGNVACKGSNLTRTCSFQQLGVYGVYYKSKIRFALTNGAWSATIGTTGGNVPATCTVLPKAGTAAGKPSKWTTGPTPTC